MSLREKILAAEDLPTEEVETPAWAPFGVPTVRVRGLSAAQREEWEQSVSPNGQPRRSTTIRASFVALCVVDPDTGEQAFTSRDVKELAGKNANTIMELWNVGRRLSGMVTEDETDEENPSTGDQEESSSSESPSPVDTPTSTDSETD